MENYEKYLQTIENQNGYCRCSKLTELFETRKKAEGLEGKCDFLRNNIDMENSSIEDKPFLQEYSKTAERFKNTVGEYNSQLSMGVVEEVLDLRIYRFGKNSKGTKITQKQALNLFEEQDIIITIDCGKCGQQIDVWKC